MLRLRNIMIHDHIAEADFYPEDSQSKGHIVVNLASGEIESLEEVDGYSGMYPAHAYSTLLKMANEKDTKTERLVMWY